MEDSNKIIKIGGMKASSKEVTEPKTVKTTSKAKKTSTTKKTSTAKTTKTTKTKASTKTTKSKTTKAAKEVETKDLKDINVEVPEDVNLNVNTNINIGTDGTLEAPFDIEEDETMVADTPVETPKVEEKKEEPAPAPAPANTEGLHPMEDKQQEAEMVRNIVTAGDRNCYLYFDIKTTSTTKNGEPVSIGIMDANRNIFYAEFSGYTVPQMTPAFLSIMNSLTNANPGTLTSARNRFMRGTYKEVGEALREWLSVYYEQEGVNVQFMGNILINEQVILYDLILDGKEISERPRYISPVAMDLNSELAHVTSRPKDIPVDNYVPASFLAANVPLTAICGNGTYKWLENSEGLLNKSIDNSLAYAAMIKTIHQGLWGIEEKTITDTDFT